MILNLKLSEADQEFFGVKTTEDIMTMLGEAAENSKALTHATSETLHLSGKLTDFESRLKALETAEPAKLDIKSVVQEAKAEIEASARAESSRTVLEIIAKSGGKPLVSSGTPEDVTPPNDRAKTFAGIVAEKVSSGMSKADAVRWGIKNHAAEYSEARKQAIKL